MNRLIMNIVTPFVAFFCIATAQAVEYVDIDQPDQDVGAWYTNDWQQTFVPSVNNITAVSIFITPASSSNVTVQILDAVCGNVLESGSATGSGSGWLKCDLAGALAVVSGNTYTIKVISDQTFAASTLNPYLVGQLMNACVPWSSGNHDLTFRTWTDEDAVSADQMVWGTMKSQYR